MTTTAVDSEGNILVKKKPSGVRSRKLPPCLTAARSSWLLSPPMLSMVSPSLLFLPPFGLLDVNTKWDNVTDVLYISICPYHTLFLKRQHHGCGNIQYVGDEPAGSIIIVINGRPGRCHHDHVFCLRHQYVQGMAATCTYTPCSFVVSEWRLCAHCSGEEVKNYCYCLFCSNLSQILLIRNLYLKQIQQNHVHEWPAATSCRVEFFSILTDPSSLGRGRHLLFLLTV